VRRLLASLPAAGLVPEDDWSALRSQLLPRLLSERFVAELPAHHDLLTRPLAPGVVLAFVVRSPRRARYLRRRDVSGHGLSAVAAEALTNLAAHTQQARLWHMQTDAGPLVTARSGDGLDSSRLLLPGLHDVLAGELGSPFLAAVPHRDALHAAPANDAGARALTARARGDVARARYPISDRLLEVHPGGRLLPARG
jgi:hypothetical protein